MNVLIFAAGLGTRLKPLTDTMPKALVPINGKPLIKWLIDKLEYSVKSHNNDGKLHIVINIHHFGQQIIDFIDECRMEHDIKFSDERDMLLETGGGLKKALPLFDNSDSVLVHNVDILSNVDLSDFYERHINNNVIVTILVSNRKTKRYLLFDNDYRLVGWTNIETGEVKSPYADLDVDTCKRYAFSGIQVVSPEILSYMENWNGKFSIIDFYLSICDKVCIKGELKNDLKILDVGKLDSISQAEEWLG